MVLLIRLLGVENQALQGKYDHPFTDVSDWADKYIGYAYEEGITVGISDTEFGEGHIMTDYMFITLVLRALGYSDLGDKAQFVWDDPYQFALRAGILNNAKPDRVFLRADAIVIFWNALARNNFELALLLKRVYLPPASLRRQSRYISTARSYLMT